MQSYDIPNEDDTISIRLRLFQSAFGFNLILLALKKTKWSKPFFWTFSFFQDCLLYLSNPPSAIDGTNILNSSTPDQILMCKCK